MTIHVRARIVANVLRYVRETYGDAAHERVLASLEPAVRPALAADLREASWLAYAHLVAYTEAASVLLAPGDPGFFFELGRYSGARNRTDGGLLPMVMDAATAARMSGVIWRSLYDAGRVEVVAQDDLRVVVRVHDFPAGRTHCERLRGALVGLLSSPQGPVRAKELRCAAAGAEHCEFEAAWTAAP